MRLITKAANVRGLACVTTNLVSEACLRHGTYPTASAALGRALTGGALMGALLKTGQRVALKFEGNGPLRKVVVEADSNGTVRGYVGVPEVDLPLRQGKPDVAGALGHAGLLTVAKDLRLKEPYQGIVQLYTSEIAEDIAFYLTESEQVPSAVGLGVFVEPEGTVSAAGGFLIQSLPPSDKNIIERVIGQIGQMPPITELMHRGKRPEEWLKHLFNGIPFDIIEKRELAFQCSCSRERMERALISLGREELTSLLEEEEETDVTCHFCHERHIFNRNDLENLIGEVSRTLH